MSPAKELKVEVDEKEKVAHVKVAPEELPLAIGKEGQNVRLASKLTGYRIEIEGDESLSQIPETPKKTKEEEVSEEEKPATTENTEKSTEAQKNLSVSESLSDSEVAKKVSEEDSKPEDNETTKPDKDVQK